MIFTKKNIFKQKKATISNLADINLTTTNKDYVICSDCQSIVGNRQPTFYFGASLYK